MRTSPGVQTQTWLRYRFAFDAYFGTFANLRPSDDDRYLATNPRRRTLGRKHHQRVEGFHPLARRHHHQGIDVEFGEGAFQMHREL